MSEPRHVVWFSCGAASAALAWLVTRGRPESLSVVYCDLGRDEHPDNVRFRADVENWIGVPVTVIASEKYASVDEVFTKRKYMAGVSGAPCTVEMKKVPRFAFQRADDVHHFGLTADEGDRIDRFARTNMDLHLDWVLRDAGLRKRDCLDLVRDAGIRLPVMYGLGYLNNNCIGCVKAQSPEYWTAIRRDFPEVFARRVEQSRSLGVKLARLHGKRVFLDELPPDPPNLFRRTAITENISCGPECAEVQP